MLPARTNAIDHEQLGVLLRLIQDGVVSRRQLIDLGANDDDLERMVRRGELYRRHPGVYVEHNGPLTRVQREWVAVQAHWPAALTLESALPDPPRLAVIHVAIGLTRTVKPVPGVVAHRTAAVDERVDWTRAPPRMRLEHVVLDLASSAIGAGDPLRAFRILADATQTRRTSAVALAEVLRTRRLRGKRLLLEMLDDLATGACSVLGRESLRAVERAHGLPEGRRQKPSISVGRSAYRDVEYEDYGVRVELDGRAFHDTAAARDADADRDLESTVTDRATTLRITFGLVFGTPCRTARHVGTLLQSRGWAGAITSCPWCE